MNSRIICITAALLAIAVSVLTLTACNTWEGAGKDVEAAGEGMQGD